MKKIGLLMGTFLLLGSARSLADVADPPVATTDESAPVYYLIQNWDTKEYYLDDGTSERLWSVNGITNVASGSTKHDVDDYLFFFVNSGNGYKIGSKTAGPGRYLDKTDTFGAIEKHLRSSHTSSSRETGFTGTGTIWQIAKCQYNNVGVEISDGEGNYMARHHSGSYNYIHLASTADVNEQVWVLWSFDELVEEAKRHGVTGIDYDTLNPQQGSSFKTLVDAITAKQTTSYVTDFINSFENGHYLIRNRQYGTYLNTNDHAMAPTTLPTQFSVWKIERANGELTIVGEGNQAIRLANGNTSDAQWTLDDASATVWHPDFSHSFDNNNRYISFTGVNYTSGLSTKTYYFGMGKTAAERKTEGRASADWELIPVSDDNTYERNGKTYALETSIQSEDELVSDNIAQSMIVRVRNVTRSVEKPDEDVFDGGGWLEDVDHVHFTYRVSEENTGDDTFGDRPFFWERTDAELMYSARSTEFYAARPNRYHASALWQMQCIAQSATTHDAATGHILPEHNIFVLRNLNTGKYIKTSGATENGGRIYPVTTEEEREAAKFFMQKLIDGQYGFYLYHGTDAEGHDLDDGGSFYIDGQGDGWQGGLCYDSSLHPTMNSNAAWVVSPAPTLDLQLLVTEIKPESNKNFHEFDWTTLYYPFDVVPAPQDGQQVTIYQGGWAGQYIIEGSNQKGGNVQMNKVTDVPAGNAVFVSSNKPGGESFAKITLNVYPPESGETTAKAEDFAGNVWRGIVESDGDPSYLWGDGQGWRDYWVLTKNKSEFLRLLHPAGSYLLPNRAYLDAETVEVMNGSRVIDFNLFINNSIDGITHLNRHGDDNAAWYTPEGLRLQSKPTKKGLYIHNGKKEIIK